MALFKQPDNIVKRIELLNPELNPYNDTISTKKDAVDPLRDIGLSFGPNFITPVLIRKQWVKFYRNREYEGSNGGPEIRYYAISASKSRSWTYGTIPDLITNVYIDGKLVTDIRSGLINQDNYLLSVNTNAPSPWFEGQSNLTISGAIGVPGPKSNFYSTERGYNLYMYYLKAGADFTKTHFYETFGPAAVWNNNLYIPDNKHYDMLIMLTRYDERFFENREPLIQVAYQRTPVVPNGSGGFTKVLQKRGNCLLELLTNDAWGLNLDSSKYERTDFLNIGDNISGTFDIVKSPIGEIMSIIDGESTANKIYELAGKVRYGSLNNTGLAITDDNIIGNISIEYPDAKTAPTQIIGTYNSYAFGSCDIIIGDDDTKIEKLNIRTAGSLEDASTLLENLFQKFQNTITIKFKGDRTLQQFSIYDTVSLSTSVFSATITIIEIKMADDYTFDIVAEADSGDAVPQARLGSARPLIEITDDIFIKPEINEPAIDAPIIIPPVPIDPTPPDEIAPPPPTELTISGLQHPYNFVTQSYNTKWYLGSTLDDITIDPTYDSNGIRTRLLSNYPGGNVGAFYEMDYSLIFRPNNETPPIAILAVADIHEGSSEYVSILTGKTSYSKRTRFHFPGFFNDLISRTRTIDNTTTSWRELTVNWPVLRTTDAIYGGNLDPIYKKTYDTPDRVYQVGDVGDVTRRFRTIHTFEEDIAGIARPEAPFWYASRNMRRTVGPSLSYFRLHFTALYGNDARSVNRVDYIGSTSFWGDGRGLLSADRTIAIQNMLNKTLPVPLVTWTTRYPTTVAPPPRNLS